MLANLPPELISDILLFAVAPPPLDRSLHYTRQRTLRAFALTSKQFYAVARPLLYEHVAVRWKRDLRRLEGDDRERRRSEVKSVAAQLSAFKDGVSAREALEAARTLPELEEIRLGGMAERVGLFSLQLCSKLRHLVLSQVHLADCYLRLPSLQSLSLDSVRIEADLLDDLLSGPATPALSALAINRLLNPTSGESFFAIPSPALSSRLDLLQVSANDHALFPPDFLTSFDGCFVLCVWNPLEAPFDWIQYEAAHVLLAGIPDLSSEAFDRLEPNNQRKLLRQLDALNDNLEGDTIIQSLFVPFSSFHPSVSASLHPSVAPLLADFHAHTSKEEHNFRHHLFYRRALVGADKPEERGVGGEAWEAARGWKEEGKGAAREVGWRREPSPFAEDEMQGFGGYCTAQTEEEEEEE
ncbi:hypothetical protein JCM8097_005738 [Rhodosporidiobolus ruineniae]